MRFNSTIDLGDCGFWDCKVVGEYSRPRRATSTEPAEGASFLVKEVWITLFGRQTNILPTLSDDAINELKVVGIITAEQENENAYRFASYYD